MRWCPPLPSSGSDLHRSSKSEAFELLTKTCTFWNLLCTFIEDSCYKTEFVVFSFINFHFLVLYKINQWQYYKYSDEYIVHRDTIQYTFIQKKSQWNHSGEGWERCVWSWVCLSLSSCLDLNCHGGSCIKGKDAGAIPKLSELLFIVQRQRTSWDDTRKKDKTLKHPSTTASFKWGGATCGWSTTLRGGRSKHKPLQIKATQLTWLFPFHLGTKGGAWWCRLTPITNDWHNEKNPLKMRGT